MIEWIPDNLTIIIPVIAIIIYLLLRTPILNRLPAPSKAPPEPPCASPEPERVDFAAFAPGDIKPNSHFLLDIWAYLPSDYSVVYAKARELSEDTIVGRNIFVLWGFFGDVGSYSALEGGGTH